MSHLSVKAVVAAMVGLGFAGNAAAITCADADPLFACIEDGNAVFVVDPQGGVQNLQIDGVDHVFLQDFIYDNYSETTKQGAYDDVLLRSMDNGFPESYSNVFTSTVNATDLSLSYTQPVEGGGQSLIYQPSILINFELIAGAPGSQTATIVETFTITNTRPEILDIGVFAFTDADVGLGRTDDRGERTDATHYRQYDDLYQMVTSVDVAPDSYQVSRNGIVEDLLNPILNPNDITLNDSIDAGPSDLQQVAYWNRQLAACDVAGGPAGCGSFTFEHTITVSLIGADVPVPAALPLALSGLGLMGGVAARRRKKNAVS